MSNHKQHPASYRDPAGYIIEKNGQFYRQVNQVYAGNYELLLKSGLYDLLVKQKKILPHTEIAENITGESQWYKTLFPQQLGFISYPYEWCFSQWKAAALLTLDLVKTAVGYGMVMKDATPFNIQFIDGNPVLIDSLSFEKYDPGNPWVAYRQFAECFIAPLLLARYHSAEMLKMFQLYPEGIPLRLVAKILPFRSLFNTNVFLHVRLPVMLSGHPHGKRKQVLFSKEKLLNIIGNLHTFIHKLPLPAAAGHWDNYYEETILGNGYAEAKMKTVQQWLQECPAAAVLDIGANTGLFAMAAATAGKFTVAIDADITCIENLYTLCRQKKITNLMPLCLDITNPSPGIGWNNKERASFPERMQADLVLALALVHHLAIGKNISFNQLAETFSRFSPRLIIEFIPKADPKVQLLLQEKEDIFTAYNEFFFLEAFEKKFTVIKKEPVADTERVLFLMERK